MGNVKKVESIRWTYISKGKISPKITGRKGKYQAVNDAAGRRIQTDENNIQNQ